ncbi:hypothetical protein BAY61_12090 [Prauserella marina]|uniref:Spectinomycin phosphotransferase n=1 Tax=Prauserella marina TaxID=530584 RepID=A0A222VP06_9PSEU|nr:phosphotransferase [Prauserella marina]ASR35614.1 hypothetical protein BAY61_12090 [Prauserella marina]PWV84523.1 spectinomycin phosphotransferase [Prauserella marina]SDC20202.1 spectinomycin phosphotransferase [Prauserella marina]
MFQAPATDADKVGTLLAEHYDLDITDSTGLVPVEGGADLAATLWTATDSRGQRFAVKWSGGGSAAGLVLPAALSEALPGSTAKPVPSRTGALWIDTGDMRLSIMEWIAGTSALEAPLGRETWEAQGRLLGTLHGLPVTGQLREWVPREDFDPSRWAALFERVDAVIGENGAPHDEPASRLAEAWLPHRADLRTVHDLTIRLGGVLRERASLPEFVPCHADPHLGNLILTGEGPVLIDFDDAVLAPAERDLMFVLGGGVLADLPVTPEHQADFMNGYARQGTVEVDTELITYYRGLRTLEDIAEPASVVLDPSAPAKEREGNLGYVTDVLSPAGLLAQTLAGRGSG